MNVARREERGGVGRGGVVEDSFSRRERGLSFRLESDL